MPESPVGGAFAHLSDTDRRLLTMLLAADSFTLAQALAITEEPTTATRLLSWQARCIVVPHDPDAGTYSMEPALRDYLLSRIDGSISERLAPERRKNAEWLLGIGMAHEAILSFAQAAREEDILRILDVFDEYPPMALTDGELRNVSPMVAAIPWHVRMRRPMGYLAFLFQFQKRVSMREGARLAAAAEEHITKKATLPPDEKRKLLGELALVQGFARFNDCRSMVGWFKKAHRLLRGPSRICTRQESWNNGSPHLGFLYLRENGAYARTAKYIETNVHHFTRVSNGCGSGFGSLIRAELALETAVDRDGLAVAEVAARLALREAQRCEQISSSIVGSFILARIALARTRPGEAMHLLNRCRVHEMVTPDSIHARTLDMVSCYLFACMGISVPKPRWIQREVTPHACATQRAFTFTHIIRGKHLLLLRDYDLAAALCRDIRALYENTHLFGMVHAGIIEALAVAGLEGEARALPILRATTKTAFKDKLVLTFAEYGAAIRPLLETLAARSARSKTAGDEYKCYLADLADAAKRYSERVMGGAHHLGARA